METNIYPDVRETNHCWSGACYQVGPQTHLTNLLLILVN
jgi:hypothetical protein